MNTTVKLFDESYNIELKVEKYLENGRVCIVAVDKEGTFGRVTVNDSSVPLEEDEIIVKTWNEGQWVPQLLKKLPNVFQDTGKRVKMGYAEGQIWKFNNNKG